MLCSPLKVNCRFGDTCCLHFQGRWISQARNQREAGSSHRCENRKSYIVFLSGEGTCRYSLPFEKLQMKKTKVLCTLPCPSQVQGPLLATCFGLVSCPAYSLTEKMEVTCSSKTLVDFRQSTWCYIPEDRTLHTTAVDYIWNKICKYLYTIFGSPGFTVLYFLAYFAHFGCPDIIQVVNKMSVEVYNHVLIFRSEVCSLYELMCNGNTYVIILKGSLEWFIKN
jgi:hypothetical protein